MNDPDIIRLFCSRSEQAIDETARKYGGRLLKLSCSITGSQPDAEECVNDTYLRAWNAIPPDQPDNLFAYLSRIIRRLSLDVLDRNRAAKRSAVVVELTAELTECLADPNSTEKESEGAAIRGAIERFLEAERPDVREMFVRRYFYMESIPEVAAAVGRSESGVVSALFRARKQLKIQLEKEGIAL